MSMGVAWAETHVISAMNALERARKEFPDKGESAARAVIDVELQNLGASRRHLAALRESLR